MKQMDHLYSNASEIRNADRPTRAKQATAMFRVTIKRRRLMRDLQVVFDNVVFFRNLECGLNLLTTTPEEL
jgi:hypothetical protein